MEAAFEMGLHALQRGAYDAAIRHFQDVLGQDAEDVEAHALISIALANAGRRHASLIEARRALALDPEHPMGHVAEAYGLILHHDYGRAGKSFARALALDPQNVPALLGRCRLAKARRDANALVTALKAYRAIVPTDPEADVLETHLHLMRGDLDQAEAAARRALMGDPEDSDAFIALGLVRVRSGDTHRARHMALTALNLAPENREAHHLLVQIKMQEKPILGYWQRFSLWLSLGGAMRVIGVLIGLWVGYRVLVVVLEENGMLFGAGLLQFLWLIFVGLTWFAGYQYRTLIERELEQTRLSPDY